MLKPIRFAVSPVARARHTVVREVVDPTMVREHLLYNVVWLKRAAFRRALARAAQRGSLELEVTEMRGCLSSRYDVVVEGSFDEVCALIVDLRRLARERGTINVVR